MINFIIFYSFWIPIHSDLLESGVLSFSDLNPFYEKIAPKYKIKKQKNLYFSKNGKRYRSLGDQDITFPVDSNASNVDEIIEELKITKISERSGRAMDHEQEDVFEKLRTKGYM